MASMVTGFGFSIIQMHRAELARRGAEAQRVIAMQQTALAQAAAEAESEQRLVADQQRKVAGDRRAQAVRQRAIADQRSKDILELANRTLFDIHDAIAILPGSVDARRTLVKTTVDYLENLEKQAGLDDPMRVTLAAAYFKVAMMQGNPQGPSLQEFDLAEKSLAKAKSLLQPAYDRKPHDAQILQRFIDIQTSLANLMYRDGRETQAVQMNLDLLPIAHTLYLKQNCSLNCRMQESVIQNVLYYEVKHSDSAAALGHANAGIALDRELLRQYPGELQIQESLGSIMAAAAGGYKSLGNLNQAAAFYRESIQIREQLLQNDPNNSTIRRDLMIVYGNYATVLGIPWSANLDRSVEARVYAEKCVVLARQIVKADANDATARHDLGMSLSRLGMIDPAPDGIATSLAALEEAARLISPIARANLRSSDTANQLALILEYEGHRLESLGRSDAALAIYQSSLALLQSFFDQQNASVDAEYLIDEEDIALLDASVGNKSGAIIQAEQVLRQAASFSNHVPHTDQQTVMLAKAWSILGITQSKVGMTSESKKSAMSAMKLWHTFDNTGSLLPHRRVIAETQALLDLATLG